MSRFFIEVSYRGTHFSGFQVQANAVTIQSELEKALEILFKESFTLTGSSRTDRGVHALQNYFHFDTDQPFIDQERKVYNLNAILPADIVVKRIFKVADTAHSRFDAIRREYLYYIYSNKDPFLIDRAFYYPYTLNLDALNEAAYILMQHTDFTSFSKRNTQVNNFNCTLSISNWTCKDDLLIYHVAGNRFLRGMVKGLVGTMLLVGTGKITIENFAQIILSRDCTNADFSVPPHGLFLNKVVY
ncbi:MAG: tRNA pseudouridine(38-40) synthase TruA [Ginsengibacter sp.]